MNLREIKTKRKNPIIVDTRRLFSKEVALKYTNLIIIVIRMFHRLE